MNERGAVLIEMLVAGGLVLVMLIGLTIGSARLLSARELTADAATVAAITAAADGGEAGERAGLTVAPQASIVVTSDDRAVTAEAILDVRVVGIGPVAYTHRVVAVASEPLSALRSRP